MVQLFMEINSASIEPRLNNDLLTYILVYFLSVCTGDLFLYFLYLCLIFSAILHRHVIAFLRLIDFIFHLFFL